MSLAFEIEQIPASSCGSLEAPDRALLIIAARRNGGTQ
jgi:hypothetical protein